MTFSREFVLVHHRNLAQRAYLAQQGSREAQELSLARRKWIPTFSERRIQALGKKFDIFLQVSLQNE
jgi:hypothetical protein